MSFGPALAIGAVAGAVVGCLTDVAATDALALSIAGASLSLLPEPARPGRARRLLAVVSLFALGAALAAVRRDAALETAAAVDGLARRSDAPVLVTGWLVRDAERADAGVRLLVDALDVRDARGPRPFAGRVQLFVGGELAPLRYRDWTAGRPVRVWASLRPPRVWRNPGSPSPRWQTIGRPYAAGGSVKSALRVGVARGSLAAEAAAAVRAFVREAVTRYVAPHDPQSAAVVTAILIGDRAGLAADVERRLQMAGTYHVIAISGGNVALLTGLCFLGLRLVVPSARIASVATVGLVIAYGGIVGGDPSVRRAVTAACLVLAVHAIGLVPRAVHLVAAVAGLLVLVDPLMVLDVGAWLSFGATAGIVVAAGRLTRWMLGPARTTPPGAFRLLAWPLAALLSATVCAEVILLPVHASVFHRVGVAGLALNLIAIPAMAVVQLAGLGAVALAPAWPAGAALAGLVAHAGAVMLLDPARLVDRVPWLSWRVPPAPGLVIAAYYLALLACVWPGARPRWRRVAGGAAVLAGAAIATAPALGLARPASGYLRVSLLDVGQGEAIAVQTPGGHSLLVDAGGSTGTFDLGGRVVTPALWALGIRRLDRLLVTHPDLDHAGGARVVAEQFGPGEIWEGVPVGGAAEMAGLAGLARRRRIPWREVRAGDRLRLGDVDVTVEHPPAPDWERRRARNDDSVVLRVRYRDVEVLLTGDVAAEFESSWRRVGAAPLRILKVAHHGSRSSTSTRFLRGYAPQAALVSAGPGNLFGHPTPEVLGRLAAGHARVFRTDVDGAIIVETDGRAVAIRTAAGPVWTLRRLSDP